MEVTTVRKASFDIFSGTPDENPVWIETAAKLSRARERMEKIAAKTPGRYFLLSACGQSIVAQIWTFKKPSFQISIMNTARGFSSPQAPAELPIE
jgi:hypothetical protein